MTGGRGRSPSPRVPAALLPALWILAGGCTKTGLTTPLQGSTPPDFQVVGLRPASDSEAVARNAAVKVLFSDRPAPELVGPETAVLLEGGSRQVPVSYRVSLAECTLEIRPVDLFAAGQVYELRLSEALESWAGVPLPEPVRSVFTTGEATAPQPVEPAVDDAEVQARVFGPRCGCCHDPKTGAYAHVLALDAASVVSASSRQDPGAKLVVPGAPERSYLLWKVVGRPGLQGTVMPPPEMSCGEPWPATRLCGGRDPDLILLERWIRGLAER